MRKLSAATIYPVSSEPVKNGVLVLDEAGKIIDLLASDAGLEDVEYFSGSLFPGFINTHCHLELSHLRNQIPERTGLVDFVLELQKIRKFPEAEIMDAMEKAEQEMIRNGIVAVGDISNSAHSFAIKKESKLYYHTFIELLGFNPQSAMKIMETGKELVRQSAGLAASLTPHAPYSVSPELFSLIAAQDAPVIMSIHNQESREEDLFFRHASGDFNKLYQQFGIDISYFKGTGKTSLESFIDLFHNRKLLLVHNTFSDRHAVRYANNSSNELFWCLCPNANRYIENTLPDIDMMQEEHCKITIGTDSLASNHHLNILDELRTIQASFPEIGFETLLQWATLNGAEFLGIDDRFGSFDKGKTPGVNCLSEDQQLKKIL